jgi:hypothetical protein
VDLASVVEACDGPGFAVAVGPDVVLFSEADESRYGAAIRAVSERLGCRALLAGVHDSDIVCLEVFRAGQRVAKVSVPDEADYFDLAELGDIAPELLDAAGVDVPDLSAPAAQPSQIVDDLGRGDVEQVAAALAGDHVFAEDRHAALAEALGLPTCAVGWGYGYLSREPDAFEGPELTVLPAAP